MLTPMSEQGTGFYGSLREFNFGASTAFGIAALAASSLSPSVNAQGATNAPAAALPDVVVTGEQGPGYKPEAISSPRIALPLRDTPQTINVVPRQVIEDQNATTLRDVLRNVPGISFQAGEGGVPAGDQLAIRGFSARTDLFVDGVRDVGGYTRDSFNIEQVEIFKGPNSTYSGRGSTGGAINMISKTPKLNRFYDTTLSYGTHDYYRGTIDLNQPITQLEGAAVRLNALYHDQDFAGRDFVHDNRWALNPTLAFGLGKNTRAILSYLHLQEDNLPSYGLPFVNTSLNPYGGASALGKIAPLPFNTFAGLKDRDYEHILNDIAGLRLEHDFSDGLKLMNQTRYARTDRDSIISAPRIVRNPAADPVFGPNTPAAGNAAIGSDGARYGLNYQLQSRDQVSQIIANQTDLRSQFDTGRFEHSLVTSLEFSHETELNYLRSATEGTAFALPAQASNPLAPDPYTPFHPAFRTGARNEAVVNAGGVSVFDTMKINEQFLFTAGLRGDVFNATYNQTATNGVLTRFERTDVEPTWRAGLVYKPKPYGSVYFGYGSSFNPSAEGLTLTTATEALPPEMGRSYELGTKWDVLNQRLSVAGAVFRTEKSNYRNTDPVTSIVTGTGEVVVQGFEIGISGRITDKWMVFGGYAFMESEITKSSTLTTYNGVAIPEQGKSLNNTPQQTASISTTYELPFKVTIGTGFQFVDARYSNNIETQGVPGYWLQDGFISWKAHENVDLRLNVSNLWDERYIDRVGGGHAIPGPGRTVILTAALRF